MDLKNGGILAFRSSGGLSVMWGIAYVIRDWLSGDLFSWQWLNAHNFKVSMTRNQNSGLGRPCWSAAPSLAISSSSYSHFPILPPECSQHSPCLPLEEMALMTWSWEEDDKLPSPACCTYLLPPSQAPPPQSSLQREYWSPSLSTTVATLSSEEEYKSSWTPCSWQAGEGSRQGWDTGHHLWAYFLP